MASSGARTPRGMSLTNSSFGSSSALAKMPRGRTERNTNFKVVIRVRPPLPRELSGDTQFRNVVAVNDSEQCLTVSENVDAVVDSEGNVLANPGPFTTYSFTFDYVYNQSCSQEKVYETTARTVVDSALQGYNATIFAYGQTGAGKTFTMEGFNREGNIQARGIIPRAIEQIFNHIQRNASTRVRFLVRASYLQIYNEQISDLLKPDRNNLMIREDKKRGVYVDGLSEWVVRSPAEIYGLMERGASVRATGETRMNEVSSRSHAVFIVIAEQSEIMYVDDEGREMSPEDFQKFMHRRGVHREQEMNRLEDHVRQTFKVGKLNLVDLAGSERVERSGATGQRLEESKQINKSLTMLGYVISALTEAKDRQHIPYRNSKLTRMLEDSLGGNCKTTMMAMISPAYEAMLETISTLKFANRAKNIRNEAKVNEDLDQKSLLRKYERELKELRAELEERSKNVVDKRRLLELDEQRRRAEADKMAATRALEARSQELMVEKEEKRKLEMRISALMNQMIRGHHPDPSLLQSDGATEVVMKEQQDKLRQEYEDKLAGLERERESIEEEKAQVDRYKQLLLKQRDIMIALTQRLVERDEQIMALQDELDAYDRHHKELEEKLDEKTALLIKFQRISMEVDAGSPQKSEELTRAMEANHNEERSRKVRSGALELPANRDDDDEGLTGDGSGGRKHHEKVRQLHSLVEAQQAQMAQMEQQVHDAKHQSGRLERVLQEELERCLAMAAPEVQGQSRELGARVLARLRDGGIAVASGDGGDAAAVHALRDENARLRERLAQTSASAGAAQGDSSALQNKCDTLVKEREAVQTILEHKIKVLVQSVAQTVSTVVNTVAINSSPAGQALTKDVAALQRLVNASIAALRNAAASNPAATAQSQAPAPAPGMPPRPSNSPYLPHDHAYIQREQPSPAPAQVHRGQYSTSQGLPKWDS